MPETPPLVKRLVDRYEELRVERSHWDTTWRQVGTLVKPSRMDYERGFSGTGTPATQGQVLTQRILDPTASWASEQLASFLGTQLINPQEDWFELRFRDARLVETQENAVWLRTTKDLLMAELNAPQSSFHTAMSEVFLDLVVFGTGCLSITENSAGRPVFVARPLTEMYLAESADGDIDTNYRRFEWTPRQILQFFGEVPPLVRERIDRVPEAQRATAKLPLLHAVFPREDYDPSLADRRGKPWASAYILLDPPSLLSEEGFWENPFITPRWTKTPGDVYGRSPAFTVLPDIRMLQALWKVVIQAAQTRVAKPQMVPDDGFIGQLNLVPRGINVYRATSRPENRIMPLDLADEPGIGLDLIVNRQQNILRAFFIDVIRGISLRGDASPLKATEVVERRNEALQTLVPPLTRNQREGLAPVIDRTFSMMWRNGLLPEPPPQLAGAQLDVDFVAPAVIAARLGEAEKMMRAVMQIAPILELDPLAIENFDRDKWVRRIASLNGVSPDLLKPEGAAQEARDAQARVSQQAAMVDQGAQIAQAAGALQ